MANQKASKSDPLSQASRNQQGESIEDGDLRVRVSAIVREASEALPAGVPADSPYATLSRDQLLGEANRGGISFGALISEDELRLVLEHARQLMLKEKAANVPKDSEERPVQEATPVPPKRFSSHNVPESPSGKWRVENDLNRDNRKVSVNGNMTTIGRNKIIDSRYYDERTIQAIANAGAILVPTE